MPPPQDLIDHLGGGSSYFFLQLYFFLLFCLLKSQLDHSAPTLTKSSWTVPLVGTKSVDWPELSLPLNQGCGDYYIFSFLHQHILHLLLTPKWWLMITDHLFHAKPLTCFSLYYPCHSKIKYELYPPYYSWRNETLKFKSSGWVLWLDNGWTRIAIQASVTQGFILNPPSISAWFVRTRPSSYRSLKPITGRYFCFTFHSPNTDPLLNPNPFPSYLFSCKFLNGLLVFTPQIWTRCPVRVKLTFVK